MPALEYVHSRLKLGPSKTDLLELAESLKTPTYVYHLGVIKTRLDYYQIAFGSHSDIFIAMKANSHPPILENLKNAKVGVDVVSGFELARALDCGFDPKKIIFSGVGKSLAELTLAVECQIQQINVESLPELERLGTLAKKMGTTVDISLRWNPDIDAKTHPYISTGFKDNKFGLDTNDIQTAIKLLAGYPSLTLRGLSCHIGSQIVDTQVLIRTAEMAFAFAQEIKKQGFAIDRVDLGGGLGIFYEEDRESEEIKLLYDYAGHVRKLSESTGLKVQVEPGRWIFGHSGVLLAQVEYVKKTAHKNFVILNSGMNHMLRPALYGAKHRIWNLTSPQNQFKCDVVGPICESSDFFGKDITLGEPKEGDWLAIGDVGAYGFELASHYNLHPLPHQILLD